ncbi:MAG: hypothetical protein GYA68_04190 [Syntrophorhabdus sp.]|nr:hypothetical protein [Syntrophorhabdus sp.]
MHVPLVKETKGMINKTAYSRNKKA